MITKESLTTLAQSLVNEVADELKKGSGIIDGVRLLYGKLIDQMIAAEKKEKEEAEKSV